MNLFYQIINNSFIKLTLLGLLGQQSLVAIGTFIMGYLASQASQGTFDFRLAGLLFLTATLSGSFVHYIITLLTTKAIKSSQLQYLLRYSRNNFNHPDHWRNSQSKSERHDVMIRSGQEAISSTVYFLTDLIATTTNILFNSISVYLVTNGAMATSIFVAGVSGILLIKLIDHRIGEATNKEILAETAVNAHLAKSWDNILLGNDCFYKNWLSSFHKLFQTSQQSALRSTAQREFWVALSAFSTTAIVLGTALIQAYLHQTNSAILVGIVVMLPRSLQLASYCQVVQSYFAQWKSLKQKLTIAENTYLQFEDRNLSEYIDSEKIFIINNSADPQPVDSICDFASKKSGRYTIRGDNGAGKTTYLLELKKTLGDSAIFIPAHHQFELAGVTASASSGENILTMWDYLSKNTTGPILLDEWDANLSERNKQKMDSEIKTLSQQRLLIEVRHSKATQ